MGTIHSLNLRELSLDRVYDALTSLIIPRPLSLISTVSAAGVGNLAPFSFITIGGVSPASVVFCPVVGQQGEKKATLTNVEETGEFVLNLVSPSMLHGITAVSTAGAEADDWLDSGFTMVPSVAVKPARVLESSAQFECRVHQIVHHGSGPSSACYVIGEALTLHVKSENWPVVVPEILGVGGAGRYLLADGGKLPNLSPTLLADEPSGDRTR